MASCLKIVMTSPARELSQPRPQVGQLRQMAANNCTRSYRTPKAQRVLRTGNDLHVVWFCSRETT